jgi:hypothetical protein
MKETDVVLQALAELPLVVPSSELSNKLRARAHARLVPARVHPAWGVAIAASVLVYLGWAWLYTNQPY